MKNTATQRKSVLYLLLMLCAILSFTVFPQFVFGVPSGATISGNYTVSGPTTAPAMMNNSRGTITTMVVNGVTQTSHWKAYVGNVTGSLTLENPAGYQIYSWPTTASTGQVFASRYNNVSWSAVSCAPISLINSESAFYGMLATDSDRINATFNWTIHKAFTIAGQTIASNTCNSTVTYVNSTVQVPTTSSPFQEILVNDSNSYMIYTTSISKNTVGYDNSSGNKFDFQMIVPESSTGSSTPYYFYVEILG